MSSDKAVNPTNVMGTTKLMGERLITAANISETETIFSSTRFGNVLGSNGSVLQIFKRQLDKKLPITITDIEMTRFVMTIDEASRMVLSSVDLAVGGEVIITKMPIMKIVDLANAVIKEHKNGNDGYKIEIIGSKPGEKLYEELMSDEETRRSIELDQYFIVKPAFPVLKNINVYNEYPNILKNSFKSI